MKNKFLFFSVLFFVLLNLFCYYLIFDFLFLNDEVAFLNIGQGDSELIRTKAGNVLIDSGPDNQILFEISKILPFYDKTIDLVIISHPNTDHFNGLFSLLEHYKIRAVLLNDLNYPASRYQKLIKTLRDKNVLLLRGKIGTKISWFNNYFLIIYPNENFLKNLNVNERSLVVLLKLNQRKFLFTGDIDAKIEKQIIQIFKEKIDILKVAHHGSKTASSLEFLESIKPEIAVIEVGENKFNEPHETVLERLNNLKIKIFRTDLNGTIKFIFKNGRLFIKPENI
ncbi:MAG: ComEC/Rec2 family competence protein [Minisyncoccia bacterium]